jgi:hypothetical protein
MMVHGSKIAEAEAVVSVNEKKWLVMLMHVQLKLDELRGPPNPWLTVACYETVPGTGEVARFPVETLGTHKDGNTEHNVTSTGSPTACYDVRQCPEPGR